MILALVTTSLLASCADWKLWGGSGLGWTRPSAKIATVSGRGGPDAGRLEPTLTSAVYQASDGSTADFYLTDLPLDRLANIDDKLDGVSGTLIHVSVFLRPKAGRTPIDSTACNAAVRQLIVSDGALGLYSGGGFVAPTDFGKDQVTGSIEGATIRLVRATNDFADLLGPSELNGTFIAQYNAEAARALSQRMLQLSSTLAERRTTTAEPVKARAAR